MSVEQLNKDMKSIDRACDKLAEACFFLNETHDWIAHDALDTLERVLDCLGDRHAELRDIKSAMDKLKEERDGVR